MYNFKGVMGVDLVEFNKNCGEVFEASGDPILLEPYVMSELLAPIADYKNAVDIIRRNYDRTLGGDLLIVGAYLVPLWVFGNNEFLTILNAMYPFMSRRNKAIIHYLNAHSISCATNNYAKNRSYRDELEKSTAFGDVPFVNNNYKLARISDGNTARECYRRAFDSIKNARTAAEITALPNELFLTAQTFIDEFITGVSVPKDSEIYEVLRQYIV